MRAHRGDARRDDRASPSGPRAWRDRRRPGERHRGPAERARPCPGGSVCTPESRPGGPRSSYRKSGRDPPAAAGLGSSDGSRRRSTSRHRRTCRRRRHRATPAPSNADPSRKAPRCTHVAPFAPVLDVASCPDGTPASARPRDPPIAMTVWENPAMVRRILKIVLIVSGGARCPHHRRRRPMPDRELRASLPQVDGSASDRRAHGGCPRRSGCARRADHYRRDA